MKVYISLLVSVLVALLSPVDTWSRSLRKALHNYEKVIVIDQANEWGAAYLRGRKLVEFPILSGDDETPTPPGIYVVKVKDPNYYSRKYKQPMPYSIFFDYKAKRAIHEGEVPDDPAEKEDSATHGCIHVEEPYIKWLYDWTVAGKTVVVIRGHRVWEEEDSQDSE